MFPPVRPALLSGGYFGRGVAANESRIGFMISTSQGSDVPPTCGARDRKGRGRCAVDQVAVVLKRDLWSADAK
jgi:hypothetical protein